MNSAANLGMPVNSLRNQNISRINQSDYQYYTYMNTEIMKVIPLVVGLIIATSFSMLFTYGSTIMLVLQIGIGLIVGYLFIYVLNMMSNVHRRSADDYTKINWNFVRPQATPEPVEVTSVDIFGV